MSGINRNDLARFNRAINDLADLTASNTDKILTNATTRAARSAAVATKQAPKNRRKRDIRGRLLGQRKRGEIPWWADYRLQVWKQHHGGGSSQRVLYVTEEKLPKFLPVPRRGVAKNAWLGAAARIKAGRTPITRAGRRYSYGKKFTTGGLIYKTLMENRIRFIERAGPMSDRIGVTKATRWIEGFAIPRAEQALQRRWAREAARG